MGNTQNTVVYDSEKAKNSQYSSSHYSLLQHNFHRPDVIYHVHALRAFLEQIPDSSTKKRVLHHVPLSCNYTTTFLPFCCCQRGVKKSLLTHVTTDLTLEQHFRLLGLEKNCEIGLRQDIQNTLQLMLQWERGNPHSPLSQPYSPFKENTRTGYVHYRPSDFSPVSL